MLLTQVTQKLRLKIQLIWKDLLGKIFLFAIFLGFLSDLRALLLRQYLKIYGDVALSSEWIWIDWSAQKVTNFCFLKCRFFLLFLVLKSCLPRAESSLRTLCLGQGGMGPKSSLEICLRNI